MSEFHIEVVKLGPVTAHPNAGSLDITSVHGGYPCIVKRGSFREGDLAVYVPVDALVPVENPAFSFLETSGMVRIRAKRLRGVFSMGLLIPAPSGANVGDDMREVLGIQKWEPAAECASTAAADTAPPPTGLTHTPPVYDLEGLRRHPDCFAEGERVIITEKIHGCNGRMVRTHDVALHIGSRTRWVKEGEDKLWWPAMQRFAEHLARCGYVLYGEVFGQVQDLTYGHAKTDGLSFRLFDIFDSINGTWFDSDAIAGFAKVYAIPTVPVLYDGPWQGMAHALELAEGKSTLADHVREGVVIRSAVESRDHNGRRVRKLIGQGYLLRKETKLMSLVLYLASSYHNKKHIQAIAEVLKAHDYRISSTWHQKGDVTEDWGSLPDGPVHLALDQRQEVLGSEMLIWFANKHGDSAVATYGDGYRAGAPIEYGMAVGAGLRVLYVGLDHNPAYNMFSPVSHFANFSRSRALHLVKDDEKLLSVITDRLGLWYL